LKGRFDRCVRILKMDISVLVLASTSPRRRELLTLCGWTFQVQAADIDESQQPGEAPANYVLRLAESKARACAGSDGLEDKPDRDTIILAADTCVVNDGTILGKPKDRGEAVEMLKALRGRSHQVLTGIAILRPADGSLVSDLCSTEVPMRAYSDKEIEAYVASGDPLDKAGAYGIQNREFRPVAGLQGCQASVMGLPLCHVTRSLRRLDIQPAANVAAQCQSKLNYACPISAAVLRGEMAG
jgi:septum formation protein